MIAESVAVLLVVVVSSIGVALRLRGRVTAGRGWTLAGLAAALVVLVFAPFSSHVIGETRVVRVIAIDVSRSMADVDRLLVPAAWGEFEAERIVVIAFGARADLLYDGLVADLPPRLEVPAAALSPANRRSARLDEALRLAVAILEGAPFALEVSSDGGFDVDAATLALDDEDGLVAARMIVPPPTRRENAGVRFVTPPQTVTPDAPLDVEVEIHGRVLTARRVPVSIAGVPVGDAVLTPSADSARLRARLPPLGVDASTVTASIDVAAWDDDRDDDTAVLPVWVTRRTPRVAVVSTEPPDASAALAAALGADFDPRPDLDGHDVVVLHECDASHPLVSDEALRRYVGSGGGLMLAGSRASFGAGDWEDSVVDELSPLASRPSGRRIVTIALDRSGSMEREGRFRAAARAVEALVERLGGDDRLRLIPFGADAPVHELAASGGAEAVRAVLEGVRPSGGTDLGKALDAALDFDVSDDAESIVVVLTDARDRRALRPDRLDAWRRTGAARGHVLQVLWFDRDETLRPLLLRLLGDDPSRLVAVDDFSRLIRPLLDSAGRGLALTSATIERADGRSVVVERLLRTTTREGAAVLAAHEPGVTALAQWSRGAGRVAAAPVTLDSAGIAALFETGESARAFVAALAAAGLDGDESVAIEEHDGGWRYRVSGRTAAARLVTDRGDLPLRRIGRDVLVSERLAEPPGAGVVAVVDRDGDRGVRRPVAGPSLRDRGAPDLPENLDRLLLDGARPPAAPRALLLALTAFLVFCVETGLRLIGR